jgi:DNA-directed RNA polymerase subunit M/transcription elongation factor TFIIS
MEFCPQCDNMLYIKYGKISDESNGNRKDVLHKYCKFCGYSEELPKKSRIIVSGNTEYNKEINYKSYINEYLSYDSTLPRFDTIKCPNKDCTKKSTESDEVIYVNYDEENMKYLYHCVHCKNFWRL